MFVFPLSSIKGFNIHARLLLPEHGSQDDVHVRVCDGRPGVQQGADRPGDGGDDGLQVNQDL